MFSNSHVKLKEQQKKWKAKILTQILLMLKMDIYARRSMS